MHHSQCTLQMLSTTFLMMMMMLSAISGRNIRRYLKLRLKDLLRIAVKEHLELKHTERF